MNPIHIIGIGQGRSDLTQTHIDLIQSCEVLVGGKRQLDLFNTSGKITLPITGKLSGLIESLKTHSKTHKIVVLASGDPLFHGIGSTLLKHFDTASLQIHPNISSVCAAFAAIKKPWHDARIISLHGKTKEIFSFAGMGRERKTAFLTDPEKGPEYIAAGLIGEGVLNVSFCVLENIGHPDKQKITWFDALDRVKAQEFASPNIVIVMKNKDSHLSVSRETHIGMKDREFKHSKGLITKSEIRAVSLSKLELISNDHVLWDIGAGSGSVSVESALLIPRGHVYAIEKHPDRITDIVQNVQDFRCSNIKVVNTLFPEGVDELPSPDRIFIGGGGKGIENILDIAWKKLCPGGVVVINTVLIQTLERAIHALEKNQIEPDVVQIQVSRSKPMPFGQRFDALNPVWIISGHKPNERETK